MLVEDFNRTIEIWIKDLDEYDFIQICTKPSPVSWSIGQVCNHLVAEANHYVGQIKICVSTDDNEFEEASANAKRMFLNNDFPDEVIEGPATNRYVPQPESKEQLMSSLLKLRDEMNKLGVLISESLFQGKTRHPGLNYFNAEEWFQFAGMHFRHHLRQKKRIDDYLKTIS